MVLWYSLHLSAWTRMSFAADSFMQKISHHLWTISDVHMLAMYSSCAKVAVSLSISSKMQISRLELGSKTSRLAQGKYWLPTQPLF